MTSSSTIATFESLLVYLSQQLDMLPEQLTNNLSNLAYKMLNWLQNVTVVFNGWDEHARWVIKQQTLTTLDNSKTGTVETVAGDKA